MQPVVQTSKSVADDLKMELHLEVKHEFLRGTAIKIPGTTILHGRIIKRFCRSVDPALHANGFESFTTDLKVKVGESSCFFIRI